MFSPVLFPPFCNSCLLLLRFSVRLPAATQLRERERERGVSAKELASLVVYAVGFLAAPLLGRDGKWETRNRKGGPWVVVSLGGITKYGVMLLVR